LQFFVAAILWIAKLRIFKAAVPKTEVLEQPQQGMPVNGVQTESLYAVL
jgi:hypothetical protein